LFNNRSAISAAARVKVNGALSGMNVFGQLFKL
jgi:hypothetical protein